MGQDGTGVDAYGREALTQCAHGGDHDSVHAEVGAWISSRATALHETGVSLASGHLKEVMADLQLDGAAKFPGCSMASPLMVVLRLAVMQ